MTNNDINVDPTMERTSTASNSSGVPVEETLNTISPEGLQLFDADDTVTMSGTPEQDLTFPEDPVSLENVNKDMFDGMLHEFDEAVDRGEIATFNWDKMPIGIALSSRAKLEAYKFKEVVLNQDNLQAILADMTCPIQSVIAAQNYISPNHDFLLKALKHLGDDIASKMVKAIQGVGDSPANVFKKYAGKKKVELSGSEGFMAMTTLTGGIRRVRLYNSGIYLNIRSIPISDLNAYYREVNTTDYEYGKAFGHFYYMFSDLSITEYVIENLLPLVICGSNYRHWKDANKLRQAISFQDFHTILWAMGLMMHPSGVDINFVCAEDKCGYITKEHVDLAKMRLINSDLINDDMLNILKKPNWLDDADLLSYREKRNMNHTIEFSYDVAGMVKRWKLNMRQASLYDYEAVGADYRTELRRKCSPKNSSEVTQYTMYNYYRSFKPWIDSLELTVDDNGQEQTFTVANDGTDENDKTVYLLLDEFQVNANGIIDSNNKMLDEMIQNYILDTKISHICFYFPQCPNCGTVPKNSHHGYIPYDPMTSFFSLALMKLLQGASRQNMQSTSKDTANS